MSQRLDAYLVEAGLIKSRERAKALIKSGGVKVGGRVITKPAFAVGETDEVECSEDTLSFVGRGGEKLEHAFEVFGLDVQGLCCADIGASTGGFTECLLRHGARRVYAVDVGHGQLDEGLRSDPRVRDMEGINARYMTPVLFEEMPTFICGDLSFISLRLVISAMIECLCEGGELVLLIKPQFEAGRAALNKKGIVKDPKEHIRVIMELTELFTQSGLTVLGLAYSGIRGSDGNIEYLIRMKKGGSHKTAVISPEETVKAAFAHFKDHRPKEAHP